VAKELVKIDGIATTWQTETFVKMAYGVDAKVIVFDPVAGRLAGVVMFQDCVADGIAGASSSAGRSPALRGGG